MAEFPALPLWTDAYLADTRELTAAQHGAYFLLLMTAWRTKENALPDDDDKLARWAAMDKRTWLKNKPVVMSFWRKVDGMFHQKRLDDERKRAEHVRNCQVQAGLASALKRQRTQSRHVATELPTPLQPPSPSPSTSTSKEVHKIEYKFFGKVIKLNHNDYCSWERSYSNIDLLAYLQQRDDWLSQQKESIAKNWFCSTSNDLARKSAERRAQTTRSLIRKVL